MIVDASVWISYLSTSETYHRASRRWLRTQLTSQIELVIPSLALPEIAGAIARREARPTSGHRAVRWVLRIPRLQIVSLHPDLGVRAAEIAADYQIRGADAVYVAVAEDLGLPLVTWDQELQQRAAPIVTVMQP